MDVRRDRKRSALVCYLTDLAVRLCKLNELTKYFNSAVI